MQSRCSADLSAGPRLFGINGGRTADPQNSSTLRSCRAKACLGQGHPKGWPYPLAEVYILKLFLTKVRTYYILSCEASARWLTCKGADLFMGPAQSRQEHSKSNTCNHLRISLRRWLPRTEKRCSCKGWKTPACANWGGSLMCFSRSETGRRPKEMLKMKEPPGMCMKTKERVTK